MNTRKMALAIRKHAIRMTNRGKSSHVGAVLSIADIMAVLYGRVMNHRPEEPSWPGRDRFILSKGHAGAAVYAVLALCGYFPVEWLDGFYQNGSKMSGHVSHIGIPGIDVSTGSLGHGLSVATGMAYAAKLNGADHRVFCLLSDGECDEGSTWEAVMFAAHHKLDGLTAIIDYNKIQSLAPVEETIRLEPFADKWRAFGWRVAEADGHDHDDLEKVISRKDGDNDAPYCVIAHTVKGKGVSFMENTVLWHYRSPQGEEFAAALRELEEAENA